MSPLSASGRQLIFAAKNLRAALTGLCRLVEDQLPGALAGFTLADLPNRRVSEGIYPSLHPDFEAGLVHVPMGEPYIGACVRAMGTGVAVVSEDILGDMRFNPAWRDLCLRAGLKSLRSVAMHDEERNEICGTFVIGYRDVGQAARWNDALMLEMASLGARALSLHRTLRTGFQVGAAE